MSMFKILIPIIGILVAVGLFFTYVRPTFHVIRDIQDETVQYAQAIEKASELKARISELKQQQSNISLGNLERLEALLPNRVDEVAVLKDLDTLATTHHLKLGDIKVGDMEGSQSTRASKENAPKQSLPVAAPVSPTTELSDVQEFSDTQPTETIKNQYTALDMSFSVTGTYADFRLFLENIERSLVLMEVTKIAITSGEGDTIPFMVSLRLYSLNAPAS